MKTVTALVSVYNSGDWLENRINNLLQSTVDLTIWCVNADSPDSRDETIALSFKDKIKYEKLSNNISVYAVWNHIIKQCGSKYVTNANTDDIVSPMCYEKLVNASIDNKTSFAYCSWYTTHVANQQWPPESCNQDNPGQYDGELDHGGVGHFPLWERRLHEQYGYFDERFKALGDADWWARCYFNGERFTWVREPLGCYLWRSDDPDPSKRNLWHREINGEEWSMYSTNVHGYKKLA